MAGMNNLVDTNILSELAKRNPDEGVIAWASGVSRLSLSVITMEELIYGLAWKPNSRVQEWLEGFLESYTRILPVTEMIARRAGILRGQFQARGIVRTQADLLIASTASEHGLTVVTRNTKDFEGCGVAVLNPFMG
ncbi:MAG TPA: type II toxin-antitoxin system VapC family toxin [Spirochaetota bacterium]|nr:type II toxin-antitoxin system VapC family toxin [Spirochaetota bacterium]HPJ40364.1 type II toxin-antitoxin system VapC family toxin [Spirochaetota bacterium]HPQ53166.1 type II toxin-antitoxin system VapC family toxin [Spirochaetota bacterium]